MLSGGAAVQDRGGPESNAAQMGSNDRGFQSPSAIGRRGSGASRRPRGLRKGLHGVRELVQELPVSGGEYAYA